MLQCTLSLLSKKWCGKLRLNVNDLNFRQAAGRAPSSFVANCLEAQASGGLKSTLGTTEDMSSRQCLSKGLSKKNWHTRSEKSKRISRTSAHGTNVPRSSLPYGKTGFLMKQRTRIQVCDERCEDRKLNLRPLSGRVRTGKAGIVRRPIRSKRVDIPQVAGGSW